MPERLSPAPPAHRHDLDGLRACAFFSVLLFHVDPRRWGSGHVGVDLFFVLSGFLITSLLWREIQADELSFERFYLRRAGRLLPGLFALLVVVALVGARTLIPTELRDLGKQLMASMVFATNVQLWRDVGYFDPAAETKPLLHLWSLGVEEQFYLLWPALLLWIGRRWRRPDLVVGALWGVSFLLACGSLSRAPTATFYLLPTRAWEMLTGALLALRAPPARERPALAHAMSLGGLLLIAGSLLWLTPTTPFPAWSALPACLGAALLIAAGEGGAVNRLLGLRPLAFCGSLSYSLYLWHWPLLTFPRVLLHGAEREVWLPVSLVLLFVLGWLSWVLLERPLRRVQLARGPRATLLAYGACSAVLLAVGVLFWRSDGLPSRVSPRVLRAASAERDTDALGCFPEPGELSTRCWRGAEPFTQAVALWGDSHAHALAPGVEAVARQQGLGFLLHTAPACPPLLGARLASFADEPDVCQASHGLFLATLRATPAITTVVLAARWALYAETTRLGDEDTIAPAYLIDERGRDRSRETSRRVLRESLGRTVEQIHNLGRRVVLFEQVPEMGLHVPRCLGHEAMGVGAPGRCQVSTVAAAARASFVDALLDEVARRPGVCALAPRPLLCPGAACLPERDGVILYHDDDHLSSAGARWLLERLDLGSCLGASKPSGGEVERGERR